MFFGKYDSVSMSVSLFVLNQMWDELTHPLFASYYLLKKKFKNDIPTLLIFVMKGQTNNFFLALSYPETKTKKKNQLKHKK